MLYPVDLFIRGLRQCAKCWRFGHTKRRYKSLVRCRNSSSQRHFSLRKAQTSLCCLFGNAHIANYAACPVRLHESAVNETIDCCHCSPLEAVAVVKQRASGYSAVSTRASDLRGKSIEILVNGTVERAVAGSMKLVISSLSTSPSHLIANKVAEVIPNLNPVVATRAACIISVVQSSGSSLAPASANVAEHASMTVVVPIVTDAMDSVASDVLPVPGKYNFHMVMDIAHETNKRFAPPSSSPVPSIRL